VEKFRGLLIGYLVIVVFAGWPVACVLVASTIASWNGCSIQEGYQNRCIVGGRNIGGLLYQIGVLGWYMLATLPSGALAFIAWTAGWVFWFSKKGPSAPPDGRHARS